MIKIKIRASTSTKSTKRTIVIAQKKTSGSEKRVRKQEKLQISISRERIGETSERAWKKDKREAEYQAPRQDLEEEVSVIGWGELAAGVDTLAWRLTPGRARGVLGPGGGGGRGSRRGRGGRLGRAPRARCGPIDAARSAATRAVSATSRHAAEGFLHDAHGLLLPGAPICSSSSRPLLVVPSRLASSRSRSCSSSSLSSLSSSSPSSYSSCFSLGRRRRYVWGH